MPFVFEVQQFIPNQGFKHIGYMNKVFNTKSQACAYYIKHNTHMRPITDFKELNSDWDPSNNFRYVVRSYLGEIMEMPDFDNKSTESFINEFVNDKIVVDPNGKIKKTELNSEFAIWYQTTYGSRAPSPKDVHTYMDKKFGKYEMKEKGVWTGAKIKYECEEQIFKTNDLQKEGLKGVSAPNGGA